MAKKPKAGKCVHCLKDPVERNWDHVFPESWYPDTTPPNLEKWKIPSCIPCNDSLGVMEDDLFVLLAHALDPYHPGSAGLYDRAKRAIDPEAGKDERDRQARASRQRRFLQSVLVGEGYTRSRCLSGVRRSVEPTAGRAHGNSLSQDWRGAADREDRAGNFLCRGASS